MRHVRDDIRRGGVDWHRTEYRLGLEGALSFLPYGTEFQASRRLFQQQLSRTQSRSYQDIHIRNGQALLRSLLKNPDDFHSHLIE